MQYWKVSLGVFAVFAAGVLLGVTLTRTRMLPHGMDPSFGRGGGIGQRIESRLAKELDLTAEQQEAIEPTIEKLEQALEELRGRSREDVRQIVDQHLKSIEEHLTLAQRERLRDLQRKMGRFLGESRGEHFGHRGHEHFEHRGRRMRGLAETPRESDVDDRD